MQLSLDPTGPLEKPEKQPIQCKPKINWRKEEGGAKAHFGPTATHNEVLRGKMALKDQEESNNRPYCPSLVDVAHLDDISTDF